MHECPRAHQLVHCSLSFENFTTKYGHLSVTQCKLKKRAYHFPIAIYKYIGWHMKMNTSANKTQNNVKGEHMSIKKGPSCLKRKIPIKYKSP